MTGKATQDAKADLRLSASEFDRIMAGALAVTPPLTPKPAVRQRRAAKKAAKK